MQNETIVYLSQIFHFKYLVKYLIVFVSSLGVSIRFKSSTYVANGKMVSFIFPFEMPNNFDWLFH